MAYKRLLATLMTITAMLVTPAVAFAHVIVTPGQAGIAQELTFNISVPNEQQTPVVNLKLDIPGAVTNVVPTAKAGWTISTNDNGNATDPVINAIVWSQGSIPVGQREDFSFSAQVPAKATNLDWKAYQTYADGTVVHWDQKPAGSDDSTGNAGPYSVTKVIDDLKAPTTPATDKSTGNDTLPLIFSLAAILISVGSLLIRKKS